MSTNKSKKIKKDKNNQKEILTNRGKPSDIQSTILAIPNIWTNHQGCLRLVKYLLDIGRHYSLHQAGKQTVKNDYLLKQSEIKKNKEFYALSERIAKELFGHSCQTKRCIVFFFRSNQEQKITNQDWIEQFSNQYCIETLSKTQALFCQKFFNNLIQILAFNQRIEEIIYSLLSNSQTPSQFSPIIQNLYIKHILEQMKEKKNNEMYYLKNRAELEENFFYFIKSDTLKIELEKFIKEIKQIFYREIDEQYEGKIVQIEEANDPDQLFQDFQNSNNYGNDYIKLPVDFQYF